MRRARIEVQPVTGPKLRRRGAFETHMTRDTIERDRAGDVVRRDRLAGAHDEVNRLERRRARQCYSPGRGVINRSQARDFTRSAMSHRHAHSSLVRRQRRSASPFTPHGGAESPRGTARNPPRILATPRSLRGALRRRSSGPAPITSPHSEQNITRSPSAPRRRVAHPITWK